jgi:hypothetical protein
MSGVMTTGSHPKALWPGIKTWFGKFYNEHATQYTELFDIESSNQNFEEDVQITGMGLAPVKDQGGSINYNSMRQGWAKRYTHVVYGQGYIVTEEEIDDNLYEKVSRSYARAMAFSMNQTKEVVAANVYNRLTNTDYTGGDGSALGVTDHTTRTGSQSNILATAADLSEASLEDMVTQIMDATDDEGLSIAVRPKCLIVPNEEIFNAERILKSTLQSNGANNDLNALRSMGIIPKVVVNTYLTDADAWFIRTDVPNGMKMYMRKALKFSRDNDFDTGNAKAKAQERYSVGFTDWRGLYATPGA